MSPKKLDGRRINGPEDRGFTEAKVLVTGPSSLMNKPACEIATASLTALEWAGRPQKLELSAEAIARIQQLNDEPPSRRPTSGAQHDATERDFQASPIEDQDLRAGFRCV